MPLSEHETKDIYAAAHQAAEEVVRARSLHSPMSSAHEGFAVLHEEFDELKQHVWMKQKDRDLIAMRTEAIQVAAMAIAFAVEICNEERGRR